MKSLRWNLIWNKMMLPPTTTQHYLNWIRLQRKIPLLRLLHLLSELKALFLYYNLEPFSCLIPIIFLYNLACTHQGRGFICLNPTKHLCFSFFPPLLYLVPYLQQFSAVEYINCIKCTFLSALLGQICIIWYTYSIIIKKVLS